MKTIKNNIWRFVLACFIAAIWVSCCGESYQCTTYEGHYSNLHAKYKHRRF